MRHKSVPLGTPCEFIDITPLNPLISKCQIKVCYVSDQPNRNRSVITKDVAKQLANSLPGNPIVGFYNEGKSDFEEHNRLIEISNGEWKFKDSTRPYGFVGESAKVWFQKFLDDDAVEREYMCTEGYLWTGQYPECQRVIEKGNNQSMELDENTLDATWAEDDNGKFKFFIINEGIISKLCILGEECEPCFEGSNITSPEVTFSFEPNFLEQMRSMMSELKELLEGGAKMADENKVTEFIETPETPAVEEPQADIETPDVEFKKQDDEDKEEKKNEEEDKSEQSDKPDSDNKSDEDDKSDDKDEEEEDKKKKKTFSLEEYTALENQFNELQANYSALQQEKAGLEEKIASLTEFKKNAERVEKQAMIDSFYMLSDEDKKDVVDNIDTYSLYDIESKLSIICVRNKVSFNLDDDKGETAPMIYNLNHQETETTPAWVQAVLDTAKTM